MKYCAPAAFDKSFLVLILGAQLLPFKKSNRVLGSPQKHVTKYNTTSYNFRATIDLKIHVT